MRTIIYILIFLLGLFIGYQLGYNNGRIDTKIEVIKKVNELQNLPIEEKIKLLNTDWLKWND